MKLTTLKHLWKEYNTVYFLGALKPLRIERTRSHWADGFFTVHRGERSIQISVDTSYDSREVLIHEMVHQWQYEIMNISEMPHNRFFWGMHRDACENLLGRSMT